MTCIEVAVSAPLPQTFTYRLSDELIETIGDQAHADQFIGYRVHVPLGGRRVIGFILAAVPPPKQSSYQIRAISKLLDDRPVFPPNLVPFFRWLAKYYRYPIGQIIKTAVPAGLAPRAQNKIRLAQPADAVRRAIHPPIPHWLNQLLAQTELDTGTTRQLLRQTQEKRFINKLIRQGLVTLVQEYGDDTVKAKVQTCSRLTRPLEHAAWRLENGAMDWLKIRAAMQKETGIMLKLSEAKTLILLADLTDQFQRAIPDRDLRGRYSGAAKALPALETLGLVTRQEERIYRNPFGYPYPYYPRPDHLTPEQAEVIGKITKAVHSKRYTTFLLHGITGSGKTEVYLGAAEKTLAQGRDVLVLVPEIALATQLEAHFLSRFGDKVVLLHSGLSQAQRYDQYCLALEEKAQIVIGARSAVFAPLGNPGLIIVDEEHDGSFKQDDGFRYHGRDIAVVRGRLHGAVVILGSATPSIGSYANVETGKYSLLTLTKRIGESTLPKVHMVDLTTLKKKDEETSRLISPLLHAKIMATTERNEQVLLLLNRRGFSAAMICHDCGTPVNCLHCHVSLTLHKGVEKLICHYCGYSQSAKTICNECRSTKLGPIGYGTERIEEEVKASFPHLRISRLDSDAAGNRKLFLKTLSSMREGEIDILIGTQMIAKGHHFPKVTLVGVIWADGGMSMPDFRAAERAFQLITQVTGRAGRGDLSGEVVIQTMRPDHYAIRYACQHQFRKLYEHELQLRQSLHLPPFVRLALIRIEGRVEAEVRATCHKLAALLNNEIRQKNLVLTLLGPTPSPLDKLRDNYRWQVLLKSPHTEPLGLLAAFAANDQRSFVTGVCQVIIDIDPENMM